MTGLLLVLALVASAGSQGVGPQEASHSVWRDIEIVDTEGRRYAESDLAGRVVLLDFWAMWCAPCLAEIPTLAQARERHSEEDFLLLGISLDQTSRGDLLGFLKRNEMTWPQVHDGRGLSGELARDFQVEAVPRSVLVDGGGNVVAVDLRGRVLLAALDALVRGR